MKMVKITKKELDDFDKNVIKLKKLKAKTKSLKKQIKEQELLKEHSEHFLVNFVLYIEQIKTENSRKELEKIYNDFMNIYLNNKMYKDDIYR